MSCNFTNRQVDRICYQTGGVEVVYHGTFINSTANTFPTFTIVNGEVTAIALQAGQYIYPWYVEAETSNLVQSSAGEASTSSSSVTITETNVIAGYDADRVDMLNDIIKGVVFSIIKDNNGKYRLAHHQYGAKAQVEDGTGTAMEDLNGQTVTFTSKQKEFAPIISSVLVQSMIATPPAPPAPTLTSLTPNTGDPADTITLVGTNFIGATAVNFGSTPGLNLNVPDAFNASIQVPALASGTYNVSIITPGGTSNTVTFTVN